MTMGSFLDVARRGRVAALVGGCFLGCCLLGCNGLTGAEALDLDDEAASDGTGAALGDAPQTPGPDLLSCAYPVASAYGPAEGQTIGSHVRYEESLPAFETEPRPFNLSELYDCDGSKGIHGILVLPSKFFCGPCAQEASGREAEKLHWDVQGLGIEVVELLLNDPQSDNSAPTIQGVTAWRDQFQLHSVTVAADTGFSMVVGGSVGTPQMTVVDPRTMQVVLRQEGWGGPSQYQTLIDLATQNKLAAER